MIDPPGSLRLKALYLQDFADACHDCYRGWIYVGYGQIDGKLRIFKFPCACALPSGKKLWECLNQKLLKNMIPDELCDLEEIPSYVLVRSIDLPYKLSFHAKQILGEVPF